VARLSTGLIVSGLVLLIYGAGWRMGLAPGSHVTLPEPVALHEPAGISDATAVVDTPVQDSLETSANDSVSPTGAAGLAPASVAPLVAPLIHADAADSLDRRAAADAPPPGLAVRIAIRAVSIDTRVKQAGVVLDRSGTPVWETLPFVAVQYSSQTGLIGARGNAVIAGHAATLNEGNVFWFLYRLELGDLVQVWDDTAREHDYRVTDVALVLPSDTSVMAPTPDETLTLITCGGSFDPAKREFSKRLVVRAKPTSSADRLTG
jgi:LPXTG-site transpeptidase (sortase) family protein